MKEMLYDDNNCLNCPASHPCPILSTRFYRTKRSSIRPICYIWRVEKFLDDPTSRVFYLPFASHQRHLEIFHDILGPGWRLVYLIDLLYLANREFFLTIRQVEFSICHLHLIKDT